MNAIWMFLFKLWMWRRNREVEVAFERQLDLEQETVRINWAEEFGSKNNPGRHHLRKR